MASLQAGVFWLGLGFALLVYGALGVLFLVSPENIASTGIVFDSAHAASAIRVGFGAPFISLALVAAFGIVRRDKALLCLTIVAVFSAMIVLARLFAMGADGATEQNLSELRDEGGSTLFFLFALWCGWQRENRPA